ncbi:hypothetical protein SLEP1_g44557 [Rubroshorea leprosula]|uniref:Uncharacterized protein n=1 Tax=Rubroshorea leprosula TaxID=152421 RepID=A0AAV5LH23_9ROSI|nr:hypothetical protein SLEP1_g44557 [Rubroshorea leprosula]
MTFVTWSFHDAESPCSRLHVCCYNCSECIAGNSSPSFFFSDLNCSSLKIENRKLPLQTTLKSRRSSLSNLTRRFHRQGHENTSLSSNDFLGNLSCKLQHLAWHPTTNLIAFASRNSLFLYHA